MSDLQVRVIYYYTPLQIMAAMSMQRACSDLDGHLALQAILAVHM